MCYRLETKLRYLADTGSDSRTFGRSETFENRWEGEYCNIDEERAAARHPDGLAFYQAQKANASQLAQNSQHIKQMLKNKRLWPTQSPLVTSWYWCASHTHFHWILQWECLMTSLHPKQFRNVIMMPVSCGHRVLSTSDTRYEDISTQLN